MSIEQNKALTQQADELIHKTEQTVQKEITDSTPLLRELLSLSKSLYQEGELDYSRRLVDSASELARKHAQCLLANPPLDEAKTLELSKQLKGLNEHAIARKLLLPLAEQGCSDNLKKNLIRKILQLGEATMPVEAQ